MQIAWKQIFKVVGIILLVAGLAIGCYLFFESRTFKIAYASMFQGNREHLWDCYSLPFFIEVEQSAQEHSDILEKLKEIGSGEVSINKISCKGWEQGIELTKGELVVHYSNNSQRLAIEKLIGDNFFGIPWRGVKD